ncbi:hypothetical protein MBLNU457_6566t1 [Dothideomycetes sp. NU457]
MPFTDTDGGLVIMGVVGGIGGVVIAASFLKFGRRQDRQQTEINLVRIRDTPFLLQNQPQFAPESQPQVQNTDGAQVEQAQSGQQESPERVLQALPPSPDTSDEVVGNAYDNTSEDVAIGARPDTARGGEPGKMASGKPRDEQDDRVSEDLPRVLDGSVDRAHDAPAAERDDRLGEGEPEPGQGVREEEEWRVRAGEAAHDAESLRWPC